MKAVAVEKHRGTLNLIPYKPGQSGNPGGRTKEFAECQRICREASPEAARTMVELLKSDDDRIRLMAADKIYERAWGKPREFDPVKDSEPDRPKFNPELYSRDELGRIEAALRLMVARQTEAEAGVSSAAGTGADEMVPGANARRSVRVTSLPDKPTDATRLPPARQRQG